MKKNPSFTMLFAGMSRIKLIVISSLLVSVAIAQAPTKKFEPVSFSQVTINDGFWKPAMEKVATTTLQACILQTEVKTPRIKNFEKVARNKGEKYEGIFYDDSDVYKALEAIAYSLKNLSLRLAKNKQKVEGCQIKKLSLMARGNRP